MQPRLTQEQIQQIVINEIRDGNGNDQTRQNRDPENKEREEIKLRHVESRINSILKTLKYHKKIEEGKKLVPVVQQHESYPVKRKNETIPVFVWSTEPPENVLLVEEKEPSCKYPEKTAIELFDYIITDELIDKIVEYSNERSYVEYDISVDLEFLRFYKTIFNEMIKDFDQNKYMDDYVLEESNIQTLIQINSRLHPENLLSKFIKSLIDSPKHYIIDQLVYIYHLERLQYFVENEKEFDQYRLYLIQITEFHDKKHVPRPISRISKEEIKHYFGALIYMGFKKYANVEKAFKYDEVLKFHSLSHRRYKEINRCIRFDSLYDRDENDSLAQVRFLVNYINYKLQEIYNPSNKFTLDEHIIPFSGRYSCSVYIKDKPHSRGLRVDCLNDSKTNFLYKFIIYGKILNDMEEENEDEMTTFDQKTFVEMTQINESQSVVENTQMNETQNESQKPIRPIKNESTKKKSTKKKKSKTKKSNQYNNQYSMNEGMVLKTVKEMLNEFENPVDSNQLQQMEEEEITNEMIEEERPKVIIGMDNYYTTNNVIKYLEYANIGYVGTARSNRSYISDDLKNIKMELYDSKQVTHKKTTLVNYKAKKDKNIYIISNQIDELRKCKGNKEKPEIVLLYNSLKGATDGFDHLITTNDIRRKSNRFQLAVLFDILNIIVTNIFIIKRMKDPDLNHEDFGIELSLKLLGEINETKRATVCCTKMEEDVNCKIHNGFLIVRLDHPNGQKAEHKTTKQICLQCGEAIKPYTMEKIILHYCKNCFQTIKQ